VAAEALEQSVLESKDKDQLLAIAKALGLKASTRRSTPKIQPQATAPKRANAPISSRTLGSAVMAAGLVGRWPITANQR